MRRLLKMSKSIGEWHTSSRSLTGCWSKNRISLGDHLSQLLFWFSVISSFLKQQLFSFMTMKQNRSIEGWWSEFKAGHMTSSGEKWSEHLKNAREKGRDLTQSYDKSPYTHRKKSTKQRNIKNVTKHFDYTTIPDPFGTGSCVRSSKRDLLSSRSLCKCSSEISRNLVIRSKSVKSPPR